MLVYTVAPGDTLWLIAKEYQISLDALMAANPQISDPNYIMPGARINVPRLVSTMPAPEERMEMGLEMEMTTGIDAEMDGEPQTMPYSAVMDDMPACGIDGVRPCIFVTKGGETLYSIGEEWGIPLAQLHYHNYQYAPNMQLPGGERIIMPQTQNYQINMDSYNRSRTPRGRKYRR